MFESFHRRSRQAELMDDQNINYDDFRDCLRDLETVNHYTFAYRPTAHWLQNIFTYFHSLQPISILDVGSGGGDMLRFIARTAKRCGYAVDLTGVDLNAWSRKYAEEKTPTDLGIKFETSDIFDFDQARRSDFIISSLFTHHLNDAQLVTFIQWMEQHALKGWFINDLHRHPLAYFSFKYISRLCRFHYMIQHDGPISVARAFTKQDWIGLLNKAGVSLDRVTISWFFPFRFSLTRLKP